MLKRIYLSVLCVFCFSFMLFSANMVQAGGLIERVITPTVMTEILAENKGKTVVFSFWATWCPVCHRSLEGLEELTKKMSSDKVVIYAVSIDDNFELVKKYYKDKAKPSYNVAFGGEALARALNIRAVPYTKVYNAKGEEIFEKLGFMPVEMLEVIIKTM